MMNDREEQCNIKLMLDVMTYVIDQAYASMATYSTTINNGLLTLYKESYSKYLIENEMKKAELFSFLKPFIIQASKSKKKNPQKIENITEFQRLLQSTNNPTTKLKLQNQLQKIKMLQDHIDLLCTTTKDYHQYKESYQPILLQIPMIKEDSMEERWDSKGRSVAMGRNILNQKYASIHDPLSYMRRYKGKSSQIYEYMKPLMREYLADREKKRILELNARRTTALQFPDRVQGKKTNNIHSMQQKTLEVEQQEQQEQQPIQELSLEALEAKFDTMFDPEPQETFEVSE
jgi:hypothetical protein